MGGRTALLTPSFARASAPPHQLKSRGFLLTSLTRYMPTPVAVVASAMAFGAGHLSLRDLPVLVALGTLLGFSYVRSRNLLTPMLIHGAWNSGVLTLLFYLTSSGIDVSQLIKEMR